MKRMVILMAAFVLVGGMLTAQTTTLRVAADAWEPYTMDPAKGMSGLFVDIMKEVYGAPAYRIDYKLMPFVRATQAVTKTGEIDVYPGVLDSYQDFIRPKTKLCTSVTKIVVRKGEPWQYAGPDSLMGRKIGFALTDPGMKDRMLAQKPVDKTKPIFMQAVYAAASGVKKGDTAALQLVGGDTMTATLIQMLVAGRFDLFMEDEVVVTYLAKKLNLLDKIEFREAALPPMDNYLGFSPLNPDAKKLADIFDANYDKLTKSAKFKDILARYGLTSLQ